MATYVATSSPVAVTTSATPAYPAGVAANDLLLVFISTTATSVGGATGWTPLTSSTAGGLTAAVFSKQATGSEAGSVSFSTPGGTRGVSVMAAYRPSAGQSLTVPWADPGVDVDDRSPELAFSGGLIRSVSVNETLVGWAVGQAPVGAIFSAGVMLGVGSSLDLPGAVSTLGTSRAAGRTGANTMVYMLLDRPVTNSATGIPAFSATAQGANASGAGVILGLREGPLATPPTSAASVPTSALVGSTYAVSDTSTAGSGSTIAGRVWRIISGGGSLSSTDASTVTVTAPLSPGTQVIGIAARSSNGLTGAERTYSVAVQSGAIPNAGPDQSNTESMAPVQLSGGGTGSPTIFRWRQISGPVVQLSSTAVRNPTFQAPASVDGADLVFALQVGSASGGTSAEDSVTIHVRPHIEWVLKASGPEPVATRAL